MDGLGFRFKGKGLEDLLAGLPAASPPDDKPYYMSKEPKSPARLIEGIQESAFWTTHIARDAAKREWLQVGFLAAFAFTILVGLAMVPSEDSRMKVGQFAFVVIAAIFTREHIGRGFSFRDGSRGAELIDQALESYVTKPPTETEQTALVALYLGNYNAIVSSMPVFGKKLRAGRAKELNESWARRVAQRSAAKELEGSDPVQGGNEYVR